MLKTQDRVACRGARRIKFMGHPMCRVGFMKLLGVGKHRFQKMMKAVIDGEEHCPYDMRFTPQGSKPISEVREKVYHFLMKLYHEAAEPIPDGLNSNKRPRQGNHRFDPKTMDRSKMKHLPAASIADYHRQCQSQHPDDHIGRKIFANVTSPHFIL